MKITVNGIPIPITDGTVAIVIDCGGARVDMPSVNLSVENGDLDAKKSKLRTTGNIHLHPFQGVDPTAECARCGHPKAEHRFVASMDKNATGIWCSSCRKLCPPHC